MEDVEFYDYSLNVPTMDEINLNKIMETYKQGLAMSENDRHEQITDEINDAYLPFNEGSFEEIEPSSQNKIHEFIIINVYKNLLQRQPKPQELNKLLQEFYEQTLDEEILKMRILNSTEYKMIVKMQSNDVDAGLISTVSSENLIEKLEEMYMNELKREPETEMLLPLKDCYIHLQYNDFLFRAMLIHEKFSLFEREVLDITFLSKRKLLDVFNKYFLLSELRIVANELKRTDLLNRKAKSNPIPLITNPAADINQESTLDAENQITKVVKDGNNVFNINIMLSEDMMQSKPYSDDVNRNVNDDKGCSYANTNDTNDTNQKCRIYNPITYKQQYRGDMRYRPNVCSYGTKQVVQPVFLNSKTLFQGTDLKEASEYTQVGSIMPKFEYREYEEIDKDDMARFK